MGIGTTELIIIFGIVLLVFGAGKIPKIARDIGSGIKEFKRSMNSEDDTTAHGEKSPKGDSEQKK
jgi:sec-independent protein translocase protein TatA